MLTSTPSPRLTSEAAPIARVRVGADPTPAPASSEPRIGYYSVYDLVFPAVGGVAGYFGGKELSKHAADDDWLMKPWLWSIVGVGAGVWARRESIATGYQRWKQSQRIY